MAVSYMFSIALGYSFYCHSYHATTVQLSAKSFSKFVIHAVTQSKFLHALAS